jgi:hypothetical protein
LNLDETGVTREIDLNKVVLMGDEDQLSKVTGMKERFTFTPVITPFGPLESYIKLTTDTALSILPCPRVVVKVFLEKKKIQKFLKNVRFLSLPKDSQK